MIHAGLSNDQQVTVGAGAVAVKEHVCLNCGCVYRYQIKRQYVANANSLENARKKASQGARHRVAGEVDRRPCPHCGMLQPAMLGQPRLRLHFALILATLVLALGMTVLTLRQTFSIATLSASSAALALVIAAFHMLAYVYNPNRNLARNRGEQKSVEIVAAGRDDFQNSVPIAGRGFWLLFLLFAMAVSSFYLAEIVRIRAGWPVNPGALPPTSIAAYTQYWLFGALGGTVLLLSGGIVLCVLAWKLGRAGITRTIDTKSIADQSKRTGFHNRTAD